MSQYFKKIRGNPAKCICGQTGFLSDLYTVVRFNRMFHDIEQSKRWICSDCYNWFMHMKRNVYLMQKDYQDYRNKIKKLKKQIRELKKHDN